MVTCAWMERFYLKRGMRRLHAKRGISVRTRCSHDGWCVSRQKRRCRSKCAYPTLDPRPLQSVTKSEGRVTETPEEFEDSWALGLAPDPSAGTSAKREREAGEKKRCKVSGEAERAKPSIDREKADCRPKLQRSPLRETGKHIATAISTDCSAVLNRWKVTI